ncbi:MAG: hypothetical protein Q8S73_20855 [Deltaproteobacteria bacterium]|nr:hypothetical protein [Myxococcales bacterium]MDP3216572.1 hypothetical protein [Deltaproteobacteria bacterium]
MPTPRPLFVVALLAACATPPRPPPASPPPPLPSPTLPLAAPTPSSLSPVAPPVACTFDEADVVFARPLTLLHALPPPGALAEYPFAELRRAARARVTVHVGGAATTPVHVAVETTMVRLEGVAHAAEVTLYPARASTFGGMVTPLADHPLRWTDASPGSLLLALSPLRRASLHAPPEARGCDQVRLRPVAPFAPDALPPAASRRRIRLRRGRWNLFPSPDHASPTRASIDLLPTDALWLLSDGPGRWARVLWTTDTAALVGWIDRVVHILPVIGHGQATDSGHLRPRRCDRATTCTADLPLFADDRGVRHPVGQVRAGASVLLGAALGGSTAVTVCDPDVEWADGVTTYVPSERASECAAPPPPPPPPPPPAATP